MTVTVVALAPAVSVEGASASLRRALTALVDNAVSHAELRGHSLGAGSGRRVEIEVCDDGPGIPQEIAPRLFDRFSTLRTGPAAPDGRRHYGLGLALVADVAANHHGRVTVADREDV